MTGIDGSTALTDSGPHHEDPRRDTGVMREEHTATDIELQKQQQENAGLKEVSGCIPTTDISCSRTRRRLNSYKSATTN